MVQKLHLLRTPLPWREERATQCGRLLHQVKAVTLADFTGDDRCTVCLGVRDAQGQGALLAQVEAAILRGRSSYHARMVPTRDKKGMREKRRRLNDPILFELQALADLAARHRKEFQSLVAAHMAEHTMLSPAREG